MGIIEVEKSLINELKQLLGEDKYKYVRGYLKKSDYEERMRGIDNETTTPWLLVRTLEFGQAQEQSIFNKEAKILIRIKTKNPDIESGYDEILSVVEKILEFIENSNLKKGYRIAIEKGLKAVESEETYKDYWGYDIFINVELFPSTAGKFVE